MLPQSPAPPQIADAGLGPAPRGAVVADAASSWCSCSGWLFYASIDPDEASARPLRPREQARSRAELCRTFSSPFSRGRVTLRRESRASASGFGSRPPRLDYQKRWSTGIAQSAWRSRRGAAGDVIDMKLVMLARNPSLYSHRRIVEAARGARP